MKNILLLQVFFKRELDLCVHEISILNRAIAQKLKRVMHTRRHLAFIILTNENERQLVQRIGAALDAECIETYYCYLAPDIVASDRGGLDTLQTYIKTARAEIGKGRNAEYVREVKVRTSGWKVNRPKNVVGGAPIKMIGKHPVQGRFSQNPHKPNR